MAVKAKRFRIGVEGATTDGRTIERARLEQMAASYNPQVYTALINLEHIKGYTPDSPFRRFGTVDKLEAEEIAEGPLKGKMALYAWITPSDDRWHIPASCKAVHLDGGQYQLCRYRQGVPDWPAATDDPASLGTEMLQFSASAKSNPLAGRKQNPENLFTATEETLIEWEEVRAKNLPLCPRHRDVYQKADR